MSVRFAFLDKQKKEDVLPDLFDILYSNMSVIAPTGNTYEQDIQIWHGHASPALDDERRQVVLMYSGDAVVGYFQYFVADRIFMMEELQITAEYQGTGLFRFLLTWLIKQLDKDIRFVDAYSHKNNVRAQAVLEHFGLTKHGMNKNGHSYYYRGNYQDFVTALFDRA